MARQMRQTRGKKGPRKTRKQGKRKGGKTRKRVMGKRRKRTMRKVRRGGMFSGFFTRAKTDGEVLEKLKKDFVNMKTKVDKLYDESDDVSQRNEKYDNLLVGYNNLHDKANTRLLGLAGLTRGSDVHVAYDGVLKLKRPIDERMRDIAEKIGKGFVEKYLPELKEVSPGGENQKETKLQEPVTEVLPGEGNHNGIGSQEAQESHQNEGNAFGLLKERGEKYLSKSYAE